MDGLNECQQKRFKEAGRLLNEIADELQKERDALKEDENEERAEQLDANIDQIGEACGFLEY